MTAADGGDAACPRTLPQGLAEAGDEAARLARELQYLTWPDRARALDAFVWGRARAMLSSDEVTAVINRRSLRPPQAMRVAAFTTHCGAVVTALLAALADRAPVAGAAQALTLLLSQTATDREAAIAWTHAHGCGALADLLAGLPGYAFYFLTIYPNDSAESFMARDAFRAALLGPA
jgi:hypothetical protein